MSLEAAVQRVLDASPAPGAIVSIKADVLAELLYEWQSMKDERASWTKDSDTALLCSALCLRPEASRLLLTIYRAPRHVLPFIAWYAARDMRKSEPQNDKALAGVYVFLLRKALGGRHTIEVKASTWILPAKTVERVRRILEPGDTQ